jgi:hypothetical protein
MQPDAERDAALLEIARRETPFETLTRTRSGADFREVAVWTMEQALAAAYEAGREAGQRDERRRRTPTRCECPACHREIRIAQLT